MTTNVGSTDKIIRVLLGLALLGFAFFGVSYPYHWLGYIGIVPLLTAAFGTCPLYSALGLSTCPMKRV
jgi:quinol-cytochrome oxidoreductase complex cytochrome b subunit